ncbi:MAG: IS4 family transposase [Planctomycetes bacterium]|nr:IS4 family transposase [Planctomycetota bacterium]
MSIIGSACTKLQHLFVNRACHPVRDLLSDDFITKAAMACGMAWRRALFTPIVSILSCLYSHLGDTRSVRVVEDWINSFGPQLRRSSDGSAFCKARLRLPLALFHYCTRCIADAAVQAGGRTISGLRVVIADSTCMRAARTDANIEHFGRHANQNGLSSRPIMRAMLFCCAGTGAVLSWMMAPFAWSERRLMQRMLRRIGAGALLIGDAGLFSFMMLSRLKRLGSHGLFRLPAGKTSACSRVHLGPGNCLETWRRSRAEHSLFPRLLRREPETLQVRVVTKLLQRDGYRPVALRLATTLLDAPVDELVSLYIGRWDIEVHIRTLKGSHLPETLNGRTPAAVMREFASGVLAFNAVRALMAKAAQGAKDEGKQTEVCPLSHTRATHALVQMAARMREACAARLMGLYKELLLHISHMQQPHQPRPPEPRAIVPCNRRFPYLRISRQRWRHEHAA